MIGVQSWPVPLALRASSVIGVHVPFDPARQTSHRVSESRTFILAIGGFTVDGVNSPSVITFSPGFVVT